MKLNKLFWGSLCIAAMALVGCEKNNPPVIVTPGGDDGEDLVTIMPNIDAPGAGKTTLAVYVPENTHENGLYAVGTVNDWGEKDTETCKFTKVEGDDTGRWYQFTFDYAADMALKVCAIPSKPELAGWSYQWGKNIDPESDEPVEYDNVILLNGQMTIELENGGQPKASGFADGGVAFVQIRNWAANPIIGNVPATKISFKHPWNGASDWTYKEAEAKGNGVFELVDYFGNNGFNVMDENNAEAWFPLTDCTVYEGAATGDKVTVRFTSKAGSAEGTLEVILVEKGEAPVIDPVVVTVRAKWPAAWTKTPTAHVWPTGGEGSEVILEKDGDFYKYTTPEAVPGLNIIFKNGEGWTGDANQTVDVLGIVEDTDYEIIASDSGKATVNKL